MEHREEAHCPSPLTYEVLWHWVHSRHPATSAICPQSSFLPCSIDATVSRCTKVADSPHGFVPGVGRAEAFTTKCDVSRGCHGYPSAGRRLHDKAPSFHSLLRYFHHTGHWIYRVLFPWPVKVIVRLFLFSRLRWQMALICSLKLNCFTFPGQAALAHGGILLVYCFVVLLMLFTYQSMRYKVNFHFLLFKLLTIMCVCMIYMCVCAPWWCVWRPEDNSVEWVLSLAPLPGPWGSYSGYHVCAALASVC